jgi:hypothetical protein
MFKVQKKQCKTCIYRKDSSLNIEVLEDQARNGCTDGQFEGYRICHHSKDVCCAGFWERHKDNFNLGRIAQRMGWVEFVNEDTLKKKSTKNTQ